MTNLRVNANGEVAFTVGAELGAPVGLYVWRPDGTVRSVAVAGDPAPGTGDSFERFAVTSGSSDVDHFQIDAQGFVSFTATTTNGSLSLWQETAAGLRRVVWPGQELPGYPGSSVASVDAARTSRDGRLAAIITNGAGALPSQAVVAQDADGEIEVVWHRQMELRTGNDVIVLDGQASFGDPTYGFGVHGNGMDGRGLTFADGGRLLIGVTSPSDSAALILELDETSDPVPSDEIDLQFRLNNEVPIHWGEELDFDAILFNHRDSDITFHELQFEFSPSVTNPDVECGAFDFEPSASRLVPRCDANVVIDDAHETGFTVLSPIRELDGDLVITATAQADHADGNQSEITVVSRFSLIGTPDGVDLAVSVDDVDAANSFTVTNVGPRPAVAVVARTTLDPGAGFFAVPDDPRCRREGDDNLLLCDLGDLAPGQAVTVDFPAGSDGSGTVVVESSQPDSNPQDNEARFTLQIIDPDPDLEDVANGCGCSHRNRDSGARWLLFALLLGIRRRWR